MKTKILAAFAVFILLFLTACAKPPQKLVEDVIREEVQRQAMMLIMYGGEGTGLERISITKEYTEEREKTTVYVFEYQADFRYVAKVVGEKSRVEKIKGRVSLFKHGSGWSRFE